MRASQEQVKTAESGRREHRTAVSLAGRLLSGDSPDDAERVSIENISTHGARVLAHRERPLRSHVILAGFGSEFYADAEVVYCERVRGDVCALGLKFRGSIEGERLGRQWP